MPPKNQEPAPVVIIGCGAITRFFYASSLRFLESQNQARVQTLCDPSEANLNLVGEDFPKARRVSKIEEAAITKGTLVIIASPPALHAAQVEYALEQGAAVLCEKPMAGSEKDAEAMIAAAQRTQGLLAIGLYRRFFPATQLIKNFIETKRLGKLLSYSVEEGGPFGWEAKSDSFFKRQFTPGGVLYDTGVHTLDLLVWWFGEPESIAYADDAAGGLEANCKAEFVYRDGLKGSLHISRETPTANLYRFDFEEGSVSWRVNAAGELSIQYKGSSHTLVSNLLPSSPDTFSLSEKGTPWMSPQGFIQQIINVIESMRGRQEILIPATEGIRSLRLINRCYQQRTSLAQPWLSAEENARYVELSNSLRQ